MGRSFSRNCRKRARCFSVHPSRSRATRFMKNSSRFEVKIARNLARSSSGVRSSSASARTLSLKSSQLRSRSIQTPASAAGSRSFRNPWSPIDASTFVAISCTPQKGLGVASLAGDCFKPANQDSALVARFWFLQRLPRRPPAAPDLPRDRLPLEAKIEWIGEHVRDTKLLR